eukprot:gene12522-biopygen9493
MHLPCLLGFPWGNGGSFPREVPYDEMQRIAITRNATVRCDSLRIALLFLKLMQTQRPGTVGAPPPSPTDPASTQRAAPPPPQPEQLVGVFLVGTGSAPGAERRAGTTTRTCREAAVRSRSAAQRAR